MTTKDLDKFLRKIEELNKLVILIKNSSLKKDQLSKCKTHEEVINLTNSWGFDIGKRWGEY